jgi:ATP-dependent DNA ligase
VAKGQTWEIQGTAREPYQIRWNDDDHISCNCPAWTTGWQRSRGSRACKHTDAIIAREGLAVFQRGHYWFINGQIAPVKAKVKAAPQTWADKAAAKAARTRPAGVVAVMDAVAIADKLDEARGPEWHTDPLADPMLASKMPSGKTIEDYQSDAYILEEKYDGHRIVVRVFNSGLVTARSRVGNVRVLPDHIVNELSQLAPLAPIVIDGELVVPAGKSYGVTDGANKGTETYVVFDIIEVLGKPVGYGYADRRNMLMIAYNQIDKPSNPRGVEVAAQYIVSDEVVKRIWARGGEGAVIKKVDSLYRQGVRSPDWIKVKKEESAVITITGWEAGKSGSYSVAVGKDENGTVIKVKTLDNRELDAAAEEAMRLEKLKQGINVQPLIAPWIGRRLVVTMQERTPDGKARHSMWDHWLGEEEES